MKCPKCGYTSFESYDFCRRCTADLVEFKQTHGLAALVLPPSLRASMVADMGEGQADSDTVAESSNDMFSFDLPTEQQAAAPSSAAAADPFSFDDTPPAAPAFSFDTPSATSPDDPFASLLATGQQPQNKAAAPPAASQGLEMNSFSWDDTPTPGQAGSEPADSGKTADDDFNSLFGDMGGTNK